MAEKIFLPSQCETGGAAYQPGKPDEKREGVAWWLRDPGDSVVFDGVPTCFRPHIPGVI